MTSTTLTKTDVAKLDASGNGTITLRPDVGQNWAPLFVRVSTGTTSTPVAYCAVFHGSPGVTPQPSQFIDDTFTANGDSSSMIAGTAIRFGEGIIFSFQNGTPGDTAVATVYGLQSDIPPNLDLIPQVPGTHFSGHLSTEVIRVIQTNSSSIAAFGSQNFSVLDVRQWAGYYLAIAAATSTAPATAINPVQILLKWFSDSNGFNLIYEDAYEFWADNVSGPIVTLGSCMIQDVMHGPYMQIQLLNTTTGTDTVQVNYSLEGTSRNGLTPYARQLNRGDALAGGGIDGILVDIAGNLVAGAATVPFGFGYGDTELVFVNFGANPMSIFLGWGSEGHGTAGAQSGLDFIQQVPTVSGLGRSPRFTMVAPKRSGLLSIVGTAADSFVVRAISKFNRV